MFRVFMNSVKMLIISYEDFMERDFNRVLQKYCEIHLVYIDIWT